MADLLINEKVYEGIEKVSIPLADGSGSKAFIEPGTDIFEILSGSFELEEEGQTITFDVGENYQIVAFRVLPEEIVTGDGARGYGGAMYRTDALTIILTSRTNASGASQIWEINTNSEGYAEGDANIAQNIATVTMSSASYPFKVGTYKWVASVIPLK